MSVAAVGLVDRAEAVEAAVRGGAHGNLVGRVPGIGVAQGGNGKAVGRRAFAVAQEAVELAQSVGHLPGPVVEHRLRCRGERARAERQRAGRQATPVAEAAAGRQDHALLQPVGVGKPEQAGRGEVAFLGPVGALLYRHLLDQLGDQEVDVGIALTVAVGAHVDRHAVEPDGEVGAVVEVHAAQEILVGLAFAAMLRHGQAGSGLQQIARSHQGPGVERLAGDALLACRVGRLGLQCPRRDDGDGGQGGGSADHALVGRRIGGRLCPSFGCSGEQGEAKQRPSMHLPTIVHTRLGRGKWRDF